MTIFGNQHPASGSFAPLKEKNWSQEKFSLGANFHNTADANKTFTTFAVFSLNATAIILEIYEASMGAAAKYDYRMAKGSDSIWRAILDSIPIGSYYGFRCFGPNWIEDPNLKRGNSSAGFICDVDASGNRFNPNKLLMDPYGREFSHDRETPEMRSHYGQNAGMYGSGPGKYSGEKERNPEVTRREFDTGPWAPKSILIKDVTAYGKKPRIEQQNAIIYETHLKGFTKHPSTLRLEEILKGLDGFEAVKNVPDALRGTYAGAAFLAPYLKGLGYNTVEFLPVHEFANAQSSENIPGMPTDSINAPNENYWGYMTYGFFAPDRSYAHDQSQGGPTREFKNMIKAFHDAGLEVYLDVVYNHTGEGGIWDETGYTAEILSFRGFDNQNYYALTNDKKYYWESTGCGNNFDSSKFVVQNLIKDSLRYWSLEMGVDGFRFDLATVLGRIANNHAFDSNATLLKDIATLAEAEKIEIIAEAWDLDGYDVGDFPNGWAEWNGIYRDTVRRFLKGDSNANAFIQTLNGDYEHFADQGGPHKSVNFLTAHDGFTLLDLVSYNTKNNGGPWPFGPTDGGSDDNLSWDSEGKWSLRRQRLRNFFVIQFLSRGVPMTLGGDEFGRTQNGNNNAYKLDSIGIWQNYAMIETPAPNLVSVSNELTAAYHNNYGRDNNQIKINNTLKNGLFLFVQYLIQLRKSHIALRQNKFADLVLDQGNDVSFIFKRSDGITDLTGSENKLQWHIDGSGVGDEDLLVLINMSYESENFILPPAENGKTWRRLIDTSAWAEVNANFWGKSQSESIGFGYGVQPYSVVVLIETK